ncbi:MAG TPA: YihA family ribosome biogenesis GTP-binding protein [Chromatiales bacterium]|nr:YihA family ribosome biogenesis GTP-binding protein [Chromatiales bacterium]
MSQPYASAQFLTSAAKPGGFPPSTAPEVAFAGRSNVGKSSVLNRLCQQKSLARTSKTPGRTQLINFFQLSTGAMLVDLPGYGFAKVPEAQRRQWGRLIEDYLTSRENLKGLVQVTDIRRPLSAYDWQLIEWCYHSELPLLLLLNKADKLKYGATQDAIRSVKKSLEDAPIPLTVLPFSAAKGTGIDAVYAHLDQWLEQVNDTP